MQQSRYNRCIVAKSSCTSSIGVTGAFFTQNALSMHEDYSRLVETALDNFYFLDKLYSVFFPRP